MKIRLDLIILLSISHLVLGQTGIGTLNPNSSAVLDINSPNKGILLPRVALVRTTDRNTIPNPQNSMFIYNTASTNDVIPGYYYWSGSSNKWIQLLDANAGAWSIHGNSQTSPETHFLGTTDNTDLIFKRNNIIAGRLSNVTLNTSFGVQSLESITTAARNTAIGHSSLKNNLTGIENTAIGSNTLLTTTTGNRNIAIGSDALRLNTTANDNVAIGYRSMRALVEGGNNNVAIGTEALGEEKQGNNNIAIGYRSLRAHTLGNNNVAIGPNALSSGTNGYNNIAIGNAALQNNTSNANTAIGLFTLNANTAGTYNVSIGSFSLNNNTTGERNTAIGYSALRSNITGSDNTAIGYESGPMSTSPNLFNTTAIGFQAIVNTQNTIRLGNDKITSITGQVNFSSTSDRRFKENIQPITLGLDFVNRLKPVEYIRKNNESRTKEWGLIAQELRSTLQEIGHTDAGIVREDADTDKTLSVRYNDLIAPLIKAVQELTLQIEELQSEVQQLKNK